MIYVKQGDTRPAAATQLTKGLTAVDLTSATEVKFKMRQLRQVDLSVDGAATITDAATGMVEYRWQASDTEDAGEYVAEWQVLWSDGSIESFPTLGYDSVVVYPDLDGST